LQNFTARFGKMAEQFIINEAQQIDAKKITITSTSIYLTDFGKFYADGIAASLFA
jgi:hypothetical protein